MFLLASNIFGNINKCRRFRKKRKIFIEKQKLINSTAFTLRSIGKHGRKSMRFGKHIKMQGISNRSRNNSWKESWDKKLQLGQK